MSSKHVNKDKPPCPHSEHGRHSGKGTPHKGTHPKHQPGAVLATPPPAHDRDKHSRAMQAAKSSGETSPQDTREKLSKHNGGEENGSGGGGSGSGSSSSSDGGSGSPSRPDVKHENIGNTSQPETDSNSSTSRHDNEHYTHSQRKPAKKKTKENRTTNHSLKEHNEKHTKTRRKAGNDKSMMADSQRNGEEKNETEERRRKKRSPDEESLQMFLSTDNMEGEEEYQRGRERGGGRKTVYPMHYTEEMKRKHEEIIRQILDEFDLEETKNKYRNSSAYEQRRNGNSLADYRFRSELMRMTGSEVIRLNDQSWSQKFQQSLKEDYERMLDEQEKCLARAEMKRLHRLRIEGVLHEDDHQEHGLMGDLDLLLTPHGRRASTSLQSRSTKKNRRSRISSEELKTCPRETNPIFTDEQLDARERTLTARRQDKIYRPSDEVVSQISHLKKKEEESGERQEGENGKKGKEGTTEKKEEGLLHPNLISRHVTFDESGRASYCSRGGSWDNEEELQKMRRMKRFRRVPPYVAKLYEEESVTGLYNLAEQLLSKSSDKDKGKKKAVTVTF